MDKLQTSPTHVPSLLGSLLFGAGGLFLLGIGLLMGFTALLSLVTGEPVEAQQTILFVAFSFEAVVLFAAAFFAFQKNLQKPSADQTSFLRPSRWVILVSLLIAAAAILIGSQISAVAPANWLLLPILTIPAIALPLGVIVALGSRNLPLGTRWQTWSVLGFAMTLTPILLLALEAMTAIILLIGVVAYMVSQPNLAGELQAVSQQIMILGPQSQAAQDLLSPYLTKPGVIAIVLFYIAVLVPAIEELLKPLGVWLLARRLNATAQGFTLGALSGAGYGLIETVGVSGQVGQWGNLLISRIGTGLLHITTSALMGAAIVLAWRERRYLRLLGTYVLAVLLHGLWNALAILFTFSNLAEFLEQPGPLGTVQTTLIAVMSILAATLFIILLLSNRSMARSIPPPSVEPIIPPSPIDQTPL